MSNPNQRAAIMRGRAAGRMLATGGVSQVAGHGQASDALDAAVADFSTEPSEMAGYFAVGMVSELNMLLMAVLEFVQPAGESLDEFWSELLAKIAAAREEGE